LNKLLKTIGVCALGVIIASTCEGMEMVSCDASVDAAQAQSGMRDKIIDRLNTILDYPNCQSELEEWEAGNFCHGQMPAFLSELVNDWTREFESPCLSRDYVSGSFDAIVETLKVAGDLLSFCGENPLVHYCHAFSQKLVKFNHRPELYPNDFVEMLAHSWTDPTMRSLALSIMGYIQDGVGGRSQTLCSPNSDIELTKYLRDVFCEGHEYDQIIAKWVSENRSISSEGKWRNLIRMPELQREELIAPLVAKLRPYANRWMRACKKEEQRNRLEADLNSINTLEKFLDFHPWQTRSYFQERFGLRIMDALDLIQKYPNYQAELDQWEANEFNDREIPGCLKGLVHDWAKEFIDSQRTQSDSITLGYRVFETFVEMLKATGKILPSHRGSPLLHFCRALSQELIRSAPIALSPGVFIEMLAHSWENPTMRSLALSIMGDIEKEKNRHCVVPERPNSAARLIERLRELFFEGHEYDQIIAKWVRENRSKSSEEKWKSLIRMPELQRSEIIAPLMEGTKTSLGLRRFVRRYMQGKEADLNSIDTLEKFLDFGLRQPYFSLFSLD